RAGGHVPGAHHDLRRTPGGQRRGGRVHRPGRQVGLRVEPGPTGSGATFRLEVELGSMPYTFMRAVGETARRTLRQGLHGCEVIDCVVTLTHTGYWARQSHTHGSFGKSRSSTAGDFRGLTPLVLMDALKRAGTRVHEPLYRFHLEIPAGLLGAVLPVLSRLRAVPPGSPPHGDTYRIEGTVPAARALKSADRWTNRWRVCLNLCFVIRSATPDDVPAIHRMIRELAEYEKAFDEAKATEEQLHAALLGPAAKVF